MDIYTRDIVQLLIMIIELGCPLSGDFSGYALVRFTKGTW